MYLGPSMLHFISTEYLSKRVPRSFVSPNVLYVAWRQIHPAFKRGRTFAPPRVLVGIPQGARAGTHVGNDTTCTSSTTLMQPRFPLLSTLALTVRSPRRLSAMYSSNPPVGPAMNHGSPMVGFSRTSDHSPASLARWSILNRPLPRRETIKTVHIYDFDNTCKKEACG